MSHFSVLVPANDGKHLEKVLLPFHEYECNGRLTNPNAKWDCWQIGGRWSGLLKLKPARNGYVECPYCGYQQKPKDLAACGRCDGPLDLSQFIPKEAVQTETGSGSPGLMTEPNTKDGYCDFAPVGFVDWDGISQGQLENTMREYRLFHQSVEKARQVIANQEDEWYSHMKNVLDRATETYNSGDKRGELCREAFNSADDYILYSIAERLVSRDHKILLCDTWQESADRLFKAENEYRDMFSAYAPTYAFIDPAGNWNQRGKMGRWDMDDKSKGTQNYDEAFWNFVHSLPDDQRVYVVDCHI